MATHTSDQIWSSRSSHRFYFEPLLQPYDFRAHCGRSCLHALDSAAPSYQIHFAAKTVQKHYWIAFSASSSKLVPGSLDQLIRYYRSFGWCSARFWGSVNLFLSWLYIKPKCYGFWYYVLPEMVTLCSLWRAMEDWFSNELRVRVRGLCFWRYGASCEVIDKFSAVFEALLAILGIGLRSECQPWGWVAVDHLFSWSSSPWMVR